MLNSKITKIFMHSLTNSHKKPAFLVKSKAAKHFFKRGGGISILFMCVSRRIANSKII